MANSLLSPDRLAALKRFSFWTSAVMGHVAEVGVYQGGSLKVLSDHNLHKTCWGFDTFDGLPAHYWTPDEYHKPNEFIDIQEEHIRELNSLPNVMLIPGLFPAVAKDMHRLDNTTFALVHLDVDFGNSLHDCLYWFAERLNYSGIIVVDDYEWPHCPRIKPVVDEFAKRAGMWVNSIAAHQVFLTRKMLP